jgi:DNA-binding NarL/FixJ family response regulator
LEPITTSVLIVDDYEPWRKFACLTLQKRPELRIVGEASDGLEAVEQAHKLQPDLILLDIGLPSLNGIEAARRIREVSPSSKILFVSENRSPDIAEEALRTGAVGCAVKSGGARELVNALSAVLEGTQFVSTYLTGHDLGDYMDQRSIDHRPGPQGFAAIHPRSHGHRSGHDVFLYPNDATLVDGLKRFVEAALKNGDVAVVVAAQSHRADILQLLQRDGVDVPGAVESQRYISLDVTDALPALVVGGLRDAVRSASGEYSHLLDAVEVAAKKHIKVAVG